MTRDGDRPVDESEYVGQPMEEVPMIDAGSECNARSYDRVEDGSNQFAGYCSLPAGWGTDHVGDGRCRLHGGAIENQGAPKSNQHGATHCLDSDPHHYYRSLDDDEQAYVRRIALAMEDRLRARGEDLDHLDRVMARRIAIEFHIVSRASEYVEQEGLVQTVGGNDRNRALLAEVRRRDRAIFDMLRDLGALDDSPPIPAIE